MAALSGYAQVFYNNVLASGVVPQISMILGPCAGGAAYSPALTDFIIMRNSGNAGMYITGPKVIEQVTYENARWTTSAPPPFTPPCPATSIS